jgi:hypothetical protein
VDSAEPVGRQAGLGICGQNGDDAELGDLLEEEVDFDVGEAVVDIFHFGAFAEEGVGLVKEQDGAAGSRSGEDGIEIFLGLADELADDGSQIEVKEIDMESSRQGGGGDLCGSVGSGKDRRSRRAEQCQPSGPVNGGVGPFVGWPGRLARP